MFGVGDLLLILLGGGTLATKSFKESEAKMDQHVKEELEQRFIERYTDPELEKKIEQDILNPDKYEEIWDRIERYKKENGAIYLEDAKNPYSPWNQYACIKRVPFRDSNGSIKGKNRTESDLLEHYRSAAVVMLMHTHGKMSTHNAQKVAMRATVNELSSWLKDGWPREVNVHNITPNDIKKEMVDTPPETIRPEKVLVLILICALFIYFFAVAKDALDPMIALVVGLVGLCFIIYMAAIWLRR